MLDAAPGTRGVLVDLPPVIDRLEPGHDRLEPVAADFFVDPLPAADAYLLMEVMHDWPDREAAAIRRAALPGARVLVIEDALEDGAPDLRGHVLDVIMLAVAGGREHTVTELSTLLGGAGFGRTTVYPTVGPMRIVEALLE